MSRNLNVVTQNQHFVRDFLKFSHFVATIARSTFPTNFLINSKNLRPQIDVFREASDKFYHISQNPMPATEFARCRHLMQPWQCNPQKTRNTTRLKCCACHAKSWRSLKSCPRHEKHNASSENDAKVLHLSYKSIFDTWWNTSQCHKVPRLPRETRLRDVWNLQKWPLSSGYITKIFSRTC